MYERDVFYEDHDRFVKLLYYIEQERAQIDLSKKKHNNIIQGGIARSRRYDRDNMEQLADQATISIDDDLEDMMSMKRKKPQRSNITTQMIELRK